MTGSAVATFDLSDHEWAALERRANQLAVVTYIPEAYRRKPADILAAGLGLAAVGKPLTPLTLKYVYVVNGTVDFMFQMISALVHEHGHEMWVVEESDELAVVAGQRRGSDRVHEGRFSIADAVKAGLTQRGDVWGKYTRDMLVSKAGRRCAKRVAPEAVLGLPPPMRFAPVEEGAGRLHVVNFGPDDDGDITDAEVVEPAPTAALGREAETTEGGGVENGAGDAKVVESPTTVPAPTSAEVWRERAKCAGVTQLVLLRRARELAIELGLALPDGLSDIDDAGLAEALATWLKGVK